jgi:glycerol-3-phosphate acyltransferase PlsY
MSSILILLASYLFGSIPWGLWIARAKGVDLRQVGSGNIGATNVGRALGARYAALVFLLDGLKGALPVALVSGGDDRFVAAVMLAAVCGHIFSVFLSGRGGKGVSTAFGVLLVVDPIAALFAIVSYGALWALTRVSAIGSLCAAFVGWLMLVARSAPGAISLAVLLITALIVWRHKQNLCVLFSKARQLFGHRHR